jgi:hypothetical protein
MRKITQGDNDWADVARTDGLPVSASAIGRWAIVAKLGGVPVAEGQLYPAEDLSCFLRRLSPEDTMIPKGRYILVTQIKDDNLVYPYSSEVGQEPIEIVAQGIA